MSKVLADLVVRRSRSVVIGSLILFLGFAAMSIGVFPLLQTEGFADPAAPSSRTQDVLDADFGGSVDIVFLVQPTAAATGLDDAGVTAVATAVADRLRATTGVTSIASYWDGGAPALKGADGRSGLLVAHVLGTEAQASERAAALVADVRSATAGLPAATVTPGGSLVVGQDITDQVVVDLAIAEGVAVPITLVLLLVAFGSVTAALLPLATGFMAVAGAFAVLWIVGSVTDVSVYAINLTTGLGLGLAIDYALLIVNRFREELARGRAPADAVTVTLRTAGRTVMFSSAIVAVALLALLSFPLYFLRSFAYAGVGVVIVAMLASVVTLPAVLVLLGERVNSGRIRRSRPLRAASEESPFWRRVAAAVMRRPVLAGLPVVLLLLVAAVPVLGIRFTTPDDRVLPASAQSRQVGDVLRAQYGGSTDASLDVLVAGRPASWTVADYASRLSKVPGVTSVQSADGIRVRGVLTQPFDASATFTRAGWQLLTVAGPTDRSSPGAADAVAAVRALAPPSGSTTLVGGDPAVLVDSKAAVADGLPFAGGWIALSTFVLLFLFTGSLLIPTKALLLNVLGLASVFGAVVWIFQDGHLADLLGFTPGPIDTSMPVLLFCITFGLSMDYEIFLLSRIKEEYDRTGDNTAAVVSGLARTGRIVTTSAALLAVTFFAFGLSQVSFLKLFGIGTALAIVVDATLVRAVLVPAVMRLAGRANWWAPPVLRRLHRRIGVTESDDETPHGELVQAGVGPA